MKKLLFMASVMMLSVSAFAQHEPGSLTIQPKVGVNIAKLTERVTLLRALALPQELSFSIKFRELLVFQQVWYIQCRELRLL